MVFDVGDVNVVFGFFVWVEDVFLLSGWVKVGFGLLLVMIEWFDDVLCLFVEVVLLGVFEFVVMCDWGLVYDLCGDMKWV